jgi:hypothetical protein
LSGPFDAVTTYFLAKDGNRPHLIRRIFAMDAELEMIVKTDAISFPQSVRGVDAIEETLVCRFAHDFENIYSFGLTRPAVADRLHFPCHWLVGMSAKKDGPLRVGCGRYDWYFTDDEKGLIRRLVINIEAMTVFPRSEFDILALSLVHVRGGDK